MKIAIFASGGGSNFQAIADACESGHIPGQVVLCVVSRADAGVIQRAERMGIPQVVLQGSTAEWAPAVLKQLEEASVDLIVLAGFMKMIPMALIGRFPRRILNIHPALLPNFGGKGMYGMHVHEAVIAAGESESGATVHLVDQDYDTGPIVAQSRVPVLANDNAEDLAVRVLKAEHVLYPDVIRAFAENRVRVSGTHITIDPPRP